jgi:hypothetical protein
VSCGCAAAGRITAATRNATSTIGRAMPIYANTVSRWKTMCIS